MYDEAQAHLDTVTNPVFGDMKKRLERVIATDKNPETNSTPSAVTNAPAPLANPPPLPTNESVPPSATKLDVAPPELREQKP
jgi:hypothetical protein